MQEFRYRYHKDLIPVVRQLTTSVEESVDLWGNLYPSLRLRRGLCTGVHGANRLASIHFWRHFYIQTGSRGLRKCYQNHGPLSSIPSWDDSGTTDNEEWILLPHNMQEIQSVMWDYVGIVRSNLRLHRALRRIQL